MLMPKQVIKDRVATGEKVVALINEGKSYRQIAKACNVSMGTVQKLVAEFCLGEKLILIRVPKACGRHIRQAIFAEIVALRGSGQDPIADGLEGAYLAVCKAFPESKERAIDASQQS